jgi:multiple sugar transport system substrate-binding protein
MRYSRNQKPAKDFMRWIASKEIYDQWFTSQQGFMDGPTKDWERHKVWSADPVMRPFKDIAGNGRLAGYAGPPNRAAAEAVTKYLIVDMYAKAVQGMPPVDAVRWAHQELVKIYA